MISNQKHKVGTEPKFTGPDEIPLLPKFLSDQNPDQASHYHLLLKEWWESVYENLERIRDMVVNFQVADLKEGTEGNLVSAKNELSQLANDLVRSLDGEINEAIQNLEGTLTKSITDHINSTNNPHSVNADDLSISTVGKTGDYGDLSNTPSEFNPSSHSHAISDITDLTDALDDKADTGDIPTVPGVATTSANGLMSSGDKTKLDAIPSGGGGGLIDVFNIKSDSSGNQSQSVPNYEPTQRLYVMPGGMIQLLPSGTSSDYPGIATGSFKNIWVNTTNSTINHWNSSNAGAVSYYPVMRFSG